MAMVALLAVATPVVAGDGCVPTHVRYGVPVHAQLAAGDCSAPHAAPADTYVFDGTAGDVVDITVRSLAASFDHPAVRLEPPPGSSAETPAVTGGRNAAMIRYTLTASGPWRITVASANFYAAGDYVLHVDALVSGPRPSCVGQELLCGQTGNWRLTAGQSCRFRQDNSLFDPWWIYGIAGDVFTITMEGVGFEPLFGIYARNLLQSSSRATTERATMTFTVPVTGWYTILTTARDPLQSGRYTLRVDCGASGCIAPYFTAPIGTVFAERGKSSKLTLPLSTFGPFTAELRFSDNSRLPLAVNGNTVTLPPLLSSESVQVIAATPCGEDASNSFVISLEGRRQRSAR